MTDCGNKLRRAEQLISGLGGEKASWAKFSGELQNRYENVTGNMTASTQLYHHSNIVVLFWLNVLSQTFFVMFVRNIGVQLALENGVGVQ